MPYIPFFNAAAKMPFLYCENYLFANTGINSGRTEKNLRQTHQLHIQSVGLSAKARAKPPAFFRQQSFALKMCIQLQKSTASEYIEHLAVFHAEDTLLPAKGSIFYVPH
ncbi:hypothetical protein [Yersinia proxima]|uniref:Uncharacterized protein n=1 Tax=Yersinia proxima TaxID=2890316 RepID=A0ABW9EX73_9GAMM|nr:hypothetical protein [Yersinia proxima]